MTARTCRHCGSEIPPELGGNFCCHGCEGAFALVADLGLDRYYQRRCVDPRVRPLRPDDDTAGHHDYSAHTVVGADGIAQLNLMVEGIHCAACVWLIETILTRQPGVAWARVNMTTRRLVLRWDPARNDAGALLAPVLAVGYRLVPYDPGRLGRETERQEKQLLRAMAVAGFAASNVMLLSVSVWAGHFTYMGPATRDLMHWISALIVLPAVLYCIRPFLKSALTALANRRTNMDVPITLGVTLACGMSLAETIRGGEYAYFDSAITLLFFLLIGRYLDSRARGRARGAAEHLLTLEAVAVTVLEDDGGQRLVPPSQVRPGQTVMVATGERIGVDGVVIDGRSDIDCSLISGETVPVAVAPGAKVFAGTLNLSGPLRLQVAAVGEGTLLAEIVRMMEVAEQGRARYVALADRVARWYAPVVHVAALSTFLAWVVIGGIAWQTALLHAVSVLIITCPCALALAVPVVQVIASGRLLRQGILLKNATALERLAEIDTVVFDKTGTLTLGRPELQPPGAGVDAWTPEDLARAAGLAAGSRHPLARALRALQPAAPVTADLREEPGRGMVAGPWRMGSRALVGVADDQIPVGVADDQIPVGAGIAGEDTVPGPELWLTGPNRAPVRFTFADQPREDAAHVIAVLRRRGLRVELLSGDRAPTVAALARTVGIDSWRAASSPADKVARLELLKAEGHRPLMVGDGLNDAPALAAAHVSLSPSSAVDVSQTAADAVFQGGLLWPVTEVLDVARRSRRLVGQNFALALGYNAVTVPLAVAGQVTPLIAAIAMSTSSLVVIGNALRLSGGRKG